MPVTSFLIRHTHTARLLASVLALSLSACGPAPLVQPEASPLPGASNGPLQSPSASPVASASPLSPAPSASPSSAPPAASTPVPGPAQPPATAGPPVASLRLQTAQRFLSGIGQQTRLQVEALSADGSVLPQPAGLEWTSSRPQDLSVDATGLITALVDEGFAEIAVSLPGSGISSTLLISVSSPNSAGSGSSSGSGGSSRSTAFTAVETKDFAVNTETEDDQLNPDVAIDAKGNFVVVWQSNDQSLNGIYARRFDAEGEPRGDEFRINSYTTANQTHPAVAMDADGDFVVVWQSHLQDGSNYGIFGQRYSSRGRSLGEEFQVDTQTTGSQNSPAVSMDADGDFVVTWTDGSYRDGDLYGILGRQFKPSGEAGEVFQIHQFTTGAQSQTDIASDSDGNFIVSWLSNNSIRARRFDDEGEPISDEFRADTPGTYALGQARVALDEDGDFAIGWEGSYYDVAIFKGDIFSRHYNREGEAIGAEQHINEGVDEFFSDIVMTPDGGHLVSWGIDPSTSLLAQRYNSRGSARGDSFDLGDGKHSSYASIRLARNADGQFVAVWAGSTSADDNGIGARLFSLD